MASALPGTHVDMRPLVGSEAWCIYAEPVDHRRPSNPHQRHDQWRNRQLTRCLLLASCHLTSHSLTDRLCPCSVCQCMQRRRFRLHSSGVNGA